MSTTNLPSIRILLAVLALSAPALAQFTSVPGETKSARYGLPYGIDEAGGSLDFTGSISQSQVKYYNAKGAEARGRATLRLFGKTFEAVGVDASAHVKSGSLQFSNGQWLGLAGPTTGSGRLVLRVAGKTAWDNSVIATNLWSKTFGPYDLLPVPISVDFQVGPVPVTVQANAGVGAKLGLGATIDIANLKAGLVGTAQGWAYGWVSAGVGNRFASCGVQFTLNFANTTATYALTAGIKGISGQLKVSIIPIELFLQLYAALLGQRATLTLYKWSMAPIETTLLAQTF